MANKQKILIVDDDANIAELISLYVGQNYKNVKIKDSSKPVSEYQSESIQKATKEELKAGQAIVVVPANST